MRGALFKYVVAVGGGLLGAFEPGLRGIARGVKRVEDQSAPCLPARLRVELPELFLQVFELPEASITVQVTVVTPLANVVLLAGRQLGVPTPGQLSLAVAFE